MENVIALILFTYPGAVCEYIYMRLVKDTALKNKPDEIFRVARGFFMSAVVTMSCYAMLREESLQALMEKLQAADCFLRYLALSLLVSALLGLLWFLAAVLAFHAANGLRKKYNLPALGDSGSVWQDIFNDSETKSDAYVAAVYRDGKRLRAGIIYEYPDDLQEDAGLILMHTRMIETDLDRPPEERTLVGLPYAHYIDLKTGTEVAFYDGTAACAYLQEPVTRSSEQASAPSSARPEAADRSACS